MNIDTKEAAESVLKDVDFIISDCDGVLYLGNEPIEGSSEAIGHFRKLKKRILFATNASAKSRAATAEKLTRLGFPVERKDVMSTSFAAAAYLATRNLTRRKVYVLGDEGECDELREVGLEPIGVGPDSATDSWDFGSYPFIPDEEVGAIVVGFDRHLSFPKIVKALTYGSVPGNLFVATHGDETYPNTGSNIRVPGAGVMVEAISTGLGRKPDVLLGKPHKSFLECMTQVHCDLDPSRTLMIGDRITSDIAFGSNCGMKTLLVLTGASTVSDVEERRRSKSPEDAKYVPNFIVDSLHKLHSLLIQ